MKRLTTLLLMLTPLLCHAHGLLLTLRSDGETIRGTAYFSNGDKAGGQPVDILDLALTDGERRQATTDTAGDFVFAAVNGHKYRVTVYGEEGHEVTMQLFAEKETRAKLMDSDAAPAAGFSWPPAWALIGGLLLLSLIPALLNKRRAGKV